MRCKYIVGIDEVGRGPIAGPLTLCAFKASSSKSLLAFRGVLDSKQLTPEKREIHFKKIKLKKKEGVFDFSLSHIAPQVLDKIGLSLAIQIAIQRCLLKLNVKPEECKIFLDGALKAPSQFLNQETVIRGDEKIKVIGLASIVAKVSRDRRMVRLSKKYSDFGFEKHKGYGTKEHYALLQKFGLCEIHRKSFLKKVGIVNN